MSIIVTTHAVERFMQRIPGAASTFDEARAQLRRMAEQATPLRERTIIGTAQWRCDDPPCVLLVKHDPRDRAQVVVTAMKDRRPAEYPTMVELAKRVNPDPKLAPPVSPTPLRPAPKKCHTPPRASGCECANAKALYELKLEAQRLHHEASLAVHAERTKRHGADTESIRNVLRVAVPHLFKLAAGGDTIAMACLERLEVVAPQILAASLTHAVPGGLPFDEEVKP